MHGIHAMQRDWVNGEPDPWRIDSNRFLAPTLLGSSKTTETRIEQSLLTQTETEFTIRSLVKWDVRKGCARSAQKQLLDATGALHGDLSNRILSAEAGPRPVDVAGEGLGRVS